MIGAAPVPAPLEEDPVDRAMRSVFSVRLAFSEQASDGSLQKVQTPTGPIYIGGRRGSAFCFHEDGYLVTCEHVRQDTHLWSNRVKRGGVMVKSALSKPPAFVVVCPYEGGGAELNWQHSWRAEFVAHTDIDDRTYQNPVLEELTVAGRVLPDKIDLAILRLVAPVAGTPLAKPPPLRFSPRKAPAVGQECWVMGYPPTGGTTPTIVRVTYSFTHGDALKVIGAMLKVDGEGGMTMPGHSGGPLVTTSGTVIGWNFRRNNELSHAQPIAAAKQCIGLVLEQAGLCDWEQLFATKEAEAAHDRQQQHAVDARVSQIVDQREVRFLRTASAEAAEREARLKREAAEDAAAQANSAAAQAKRAAARAAEAEALAQQKRAVLTVNTGGPSCASARTSATESLSAGRSGRLGGAEGGILTLTLTLSLSLSLSLSLRLTLTPTPTLTLFT